MKYRIEGGSMPVVICQVRAGETMVTQGGGMSWMTPGFTMETSAGGVKKLLGKLLSGESAFFNRYTAAKGGEIAFAASVPGTIIPFDITPGKEIIVQKSGFLASESGVELSVYFKKNLGTGFFGGEGFIMQKLSGNGTAFVEIDGSVVEYTLGAGEQMIIDTGNLAAMEATCTMDIQQVSGVKNVLFGGEGLFNTVVTGPGKIYLQTMPVSTLAAIVSKLIPSKS